MGDIIPDFPPDFPTSPGDFHPDDFVPYPPHPPPSPRPNYYYNHARFKYATLTVLCCGTIALVIICWKCCRKGGKGRVAQSPVIAAPSLYNNYIEPSGLPPPPYTPTYGPNCYENPPPYSGFYSRPDQEYNIVEKASNKGERHFCRTEDTVIRSPDIRIISIQEVK